MDSRNHFENRKNELIIKIFSWNEEYFIYPNQSFE